ncbi:MAG: YegS/Rv2252/BmrU family lipid kinase [Flavobacteriales bacterium]|nr:YegS/Rv2252/BmrU family lipid kinase [Flavobacteriales bacterium]
MKATLILNPLSGKRRALSIQKMATHMATELGATINIQVIGSPGHGTVLAREAVAHGVDRVICAGGDGTLNAVAAGLIGTSVPLGVVAMGSGNGYARSLGLSLRPEAALRTAFTGSAAQMDVCYVNDLPFLGTAGIGFDARVSWEFDKSTSRGLWGYMRIILKEIVTAKPMPVRITVNGTTQDAEVLMLVFANTREFGNGAIISPGSAPDDGLAELQLVSKPWLLPLFKAFYDVYTGRADRSKYIRTVVAREAAVHQAGTIAHLDGEPVKIGHDIRFRLEAKRLWVVR